MVVYANVDEQVDVTAASVGVPIHGRIVRDAITCTTRLFLHLSFSLYMYVIFNDNFPSRHGE